MGSAVQHLNELGKTSIQAETVCQVLKLWQKLAVSHMHAELSAVKYSEQSGAGAVEPCLFLIMGVAQ